VVHCDERVCLSVCPYAYIRNHTSDLHQIYSSYYLWLTPLLPTLRHVMYFRFCGWRHACICNVTRLASDSPGETPNRGRSVISTIAMSDACYFTNTWWTTYTDFFVLNWSERPWMRLLWPTEKRGVNKIRNQKPCLLDSCEWIALRVCLQYRRILLCGSL